MEQEAIQKGKKKSKLLMWIIIVNLILWPIAIYLILDSSQPGQFTPEKSAYYAAREAVSRHLKVPSTAEYQPYTDGMVTVRENNKYTVNLWVDAENSFGAKIRSHFTVDVELQDGAWYYTNIQER